MRLADPQGLHKSVDIVGEKVGGLEAFGCVCVASPSEVERDAGKVLGVLCHLEDVAGVISGQKTNENEGLFASLLVIVHRDVVSFDLRHKSQSLSHVVRVTHTSHWGEILCLSNWQVNEGRGVGGIFGRLSSKHRIALIDPRGFGQFSMSAMAC